MVEQMGEAFDNLALAATTKQSTMDQMVKAIADLTDAYGVMEEAEAAAQGVLTDAEAARDVIGEQLDALQEVVANDR